MRSFLFVLVAFLGLAGCHTGLNPGRCNSTSDCPTGQSCDLTQNGVCVCDSPGCADAGGGTGGGTAGVTGSGGSGGNGGSGGSGGVAGMGTDGGGHDADGSQGCHTTCASPTPFCLSGTCVGCVTSADCASPTRPICNTSTNTCTACTSDTQCSDKLGSDPGVCMAHLDGHCATVAETIYVQNQTSLCSDSAPASDPGAGTVGKPLCSMQPLLAFLSSTRDLVVVRGGVAGGSWTFSNQGANETSIVGQQNAAIAPAGFAPGFSMQSGIAYLRNVTFPASSSIGISATGGRLVLDKVTVNGCTGGGILLDAASFDIQNTTIKSNGPGTFNGLTSWGGILVNNPPSGGPTQISLSTVQTNNGGGISCSAGIQGTDVLVDSNTNTPSQIGASCGFSSCGTASTTCGAQ